MPNLGTGANVTWVLYDSVIAGAAQTQASLFTIPIGGVAGKTKYHTNMRLAGQLSADSAFKIQALACGCTPTQGKANLALFLNGFFELYVGGKIWYEAPIFTVPAGYGMHVAFMPGNLGVDDVTQNGLPDSRNLLALNREIALKPNEELRVDFHWQAALTADEIFWFFLYGEATKPLQ